MTVKEAKKIWRSARFFFTFQFNGDFDVVLLGWMRFLWWLRGDKKRIEDVEGWLGGRNILPSGKLWGRFYISQTDDGILLNYNHRLNKWYEKPIRDTIRLSKDDSVFVGRFRWLLIRGWFLLKRV